MGEDVCTLFTFKKNHDSALMVFLDFFVSLEVLSILISSSTVSYSVSNLLTGFEPSLVVDE
jgi:hypothetical protein